MNTKLQNKFKTFKFMRKKGKMPTPFNLFYIECGDGWFKLLWKLCEDIKKNLKKNEELVITQIKEKFGILRIYYYGGDDNIRFLIENAEDKSETICEDCGKIGKIVEYRHWSRCQCEKCFKEWKRRTNENLFSTPNKRT